jgi:hypothetical protein
MSNPFARVAVIAAVAWAAAVVSSPFVFPASHLEMQRRADLDALQQSFGGQSSQRVRHFAARLRDPGPVRSLADSRTGDPPQPANRRQFPGGIAAAAVIGAMDSWWRRGLLLQSDLALARLGIAGTWLMALWPLMLAALHEGLMHRHLRRARAARARPTAFRFAGLAVLGLLAVPVVLLTLPLPWPQGWTPGWALALSLAVAVRMALD